MSQNLVCSTEFPVSALAHAIDNISAPLMVFFPNFNNEGSTLCCNITSIQHSDFPAHIDEEGNVMEFFEIPADAVLSAL